MDETSLSGRDPGANRQHTRATMRDVAALSGVSLKTVSRVVNGEAGVGDPLRERVRDALARLDYRPNLGASNLRRAGGRTGSIGVLVQDISNSFSAALLHALEVAGRQNGTAVLAASLDEEEERERALVADLVARRVDGLVLVPASTDQQYLVPEVRAGLPVVFADRAPHGVVTDSVIVDNLGGARLASDHLLSRGHRRIALLGDLEEIQTARLRHRGYRDSLADAGVSVDESLVCRGLRTSADAESAVWQLLALAEPPTAVFATRNTLTVGAARALRATGRQHDIALVGFDDFPLADLVSPAVTVVSQDVPALAATVAELLFGRLAGDRSPARQVVLDTTLIPRGSGEIAPGDDMALSGTAG